jgi:hypothetical protein
MYLRMYYIPRGLVKIRAGVTVVGGTRPQSLQVMVCLSSMVLGGKFCGSVLLLLCILNDS